VSVTRRLVLGELLAAIAGLAIHRHYLSGSDEGVHARIGDLRRILADLDIASQAGLRIHEVDAVKGYARWASTYDDPANPMFEYEQSVVRPLLDTLPIGRILDAACGTGRHLTYLRDRGHVVAGFDQSPEMLAVAKTKVPEADFRIGQLDQIPWTAGSFDAAVCALALTHARDLGGPISELARIVRSGGRIVISDIHPVGIMIDYQALFESNDERVAFIRNYFHLHSEYLESFARAGLRVRRCVEPTVQPGTGPLRSQASRVMSEAAAMAYLGLPMVLVWDLDHL
jgi:SAM-dependent methyltransferase